MQNEESAGQYRSCNLYMWTTERTVFMYVMRSTPKLPFKLNRVFPSEEAAAFDIFDVVDQDGAHRSPPRNDQACGAWIGRSLSIACDGQHLWRLASFCGRSDQLLMRPCGKWLMGADTPRG